MNKDIITVGDRESADINLIWFHGYGANNWGFEPFIKLLNFWIQSVMFAVILVGATYYAINKIF